MRIMVLSHSCVVDVNQQLLQSLCSLPDVELLLLSPANWISDVSGKPMKPQNLSDARFPILRLPVLFPGNVNLHFYTTFPTKAILRFAPDVIYSTQEPFSLSNYQALFLAQKHKIPFVFHTNQNILKLYPPPFSWIESQSFKNADYALAFSQEALDVMMRKGRSRPSAVVPYATDISRFVPSEIDKTMTRSEYGIPSDAIVFGFMGRFVPEKGLADFLEAAAILLQNNVALGGRLRLLLIGSGSEEAALRSRADKLGISDHLTIAGAVPHRDAARYMNAMDVFVLPSRTLSNWKEQFGRVLIESMSCRIPVIGSDSGEIPNLIRATGGGLIFREGDTSDLALKMTDLATHTLKRMKLGEVGAQSVADSYSLTAVAARLYKIFEVSRQTYMSLNQQPV